MFIQLLLFKVLNSPETRYFFSALENWSGSQQIEHFAWYGFGICELAASILLFTRWRFWGAILAFLVVSGVICFQLFTPLGIKLPVFDEKGISLNETDGGLFFITVCLTWIAALILIIKCWGDQ